MSTINEHTVYDELLDLYVGTANAEQLRDFRLSPTQQGRLDFFLQSNREGTISINDRLELQEFEQLEHLGRMLKARLGRISQS
jgi:hypothetical protein